MAARDWQREIDEWTERFRGVDNPPEPFATALRDGWTDEARTELARAAQAELERHESFMAQITAGGEDMVRLDCRAGSCDVCARYCGSAYSVGGATEGLPAPPPMPICPACRHTLNLLTPFFMNGIGVDLDEMIDAAVPYEE